jgi:hypothetical protein
MRVVNALMFVTGSAVLFRTVRRGFGAVPAFAGLAVLLFVPSLFVWSISLLKESLFFLLTSLLIAATMRLVRDRRASMAMPSLAIIVVCLWMLDDLRRGGLLLSMAGIALGLAMRAILARPVRIAIAAVGLIGVVALAASNDAVHTRFIGGVTQAAQVQAGHVFTTGHAYKLLDEGFYMLPRSPEALTGSQSLRFLARAAGSFMWTPLPWEMRSTGELAFLPELLLWYGMLVLAPIGFAAGWKRSPLLVCVLTGYAIPTAATLAVTNGNVGTLLRLRALVTPQLAWIAAIGLLAVIAALLERSRGTATAAFAAEGSRP